MKRTSSSRVNQALHTHCGKTYKLFVHNSYFFVYKYTTWQNIVCWIPISFFSDWNFEPGFKNIQKCILSLLFSRGKNFHRVKMNAQSMNLLLSIHKKWKLIVKGLQFSFPFAQSFLHLQDYDERLKLKRTNFPLSVFDSSF